MADKSIYQDRGYKDRADYLSGLSDEYDLPLDLDEAIADLLGPTEDFDGLVIALQDEAEAQDRLDIQL